MLDEGGFGAVRKLWVEQAEGLAKEICVRVGDDEYRGIFEGLGSGGELVLRLADGNRKEIIAGDVTELNL
jgi:biotin-(acetyl-CoA carboxylase) ligase